MERCSWNQPADTKIIVLFTLFLQTLLYKKMFSKIAIVLCKFELETSNIIIEHELTLSWQLAANF